MIIRLLLWVLFTVALIIDIHHASGGLSVELHNPTSILCFLMSLFSVISLVYLLENLIRIKKSELLFASFAFVFAVLFYFIKRTHHPLSFSIMANHYDQLMFGQVWIVVFELLKETFIAADFFWSTVFALLIYFSFRFQKNQQKTSARALLFSSTLCLSILTFTSVALPYSYDPVTQFGRSVFSYYNIENNQLIFRSKQQPLLPTITIDSKFKNLQKPHIFLVMVESFNGRFVNQKSEDGTEFTPYFNKLTHENLYLKNYFSNSVYTAKGHFAALCGQIPSLKDSEFRNSRCFQKNCVADLLSQNGYQTHFLQADPNLNSENSKTFLSNHGIQDLPAISPSCKQDKERCYGYGVKDRVFYDRAFEYLKGVDFTNHPQFVAMATVATHMPFTFLDSNERKFYKKPQNRKEHYLNMMALIDEGIENLVKRFRESPYSQNSILIITGDHGFPLGEHGSVQNQNFAYLENFGVPLLIIDERQNLKSDYSKIESQPASHLNLGSTILDLAGIDGPTDFIQNSIFHKSSQKQTIYLVQPHSGGYQAVVRWPYSYIFEEFKRKEEVYDLAHDYEQRRPLALKDDDLLDDLRQQTSQIYRQQLLFTCH